MIPDYSLLVVPKVPKLYEHEMCVVQKAIVGLWGKPPVSCMLPRGTISRALKGAQGANPLNIF